LQIVQYYVALNGSEGQRQPTGRFWRKAVVPNIGCVRLHSKNLDVVRS